MLSLHRNTVIPLALGFVFPAGASVRADGDAALRKSQAFLEKKAGTVRSVTATVTVKGTMTLMDGHHPVDCAYETKAAVIVARSPAGRTGKKPKRSGTSSGHPRDAAAAPGDTLCWSVIWEPPEYSRDCLNADQIAVLESSVHDGEHLYWVFQGMIEGPGLTRLAFRRKAAALSSAELADLTTELRQDFGMFWGIAPEEVLVPRVGTIDRWKEMWTLEAKPDQRLGNDPVIVLQRTPRNAGEGTTGKGTRELFCYSKKSGVLRQYEQHGGAGHVLLTVGELRVNQPIPKGAFEFKPPAGVDVQDHEPPKLAPMDGA